MLQIHAQINKMIIEPMMKPMQVERKLVKVRKAIYKVWHNLSDLKMLTYQLAK